MSTTKSEFLNELKARGYVHQVTDEADLDALAISGCITGYIGFDCTDSSVARTRPAATLSRTNRMPPISKVSRMNTVTCGRP
jgi:hypothetical protein